jgi:hypothetical protein
LAMFARSEFLWNESRPFENQRKQRPPETAEAKGEPTNCPQSCDRLFQKHLQETRNGFKVAADTLDERIRERSLAGNKSAPQSLQLSRSPLRL